MATLIVNDISAAVGVIDANGGAVLEGPTETPNGLRMVARHRDGAIFEYIELSPQVSR